MAQKHVVQKGPSNIALSKIGKIKTFQEIWHSQWQYQLKVTFFPYINGSNSNSYK